MLDDSYPDCVYMGDLTRNGHTLDVFLCRAAWDSAFEALLSDRQLAARRSIVFAPTPRGVSLDLVHRYPPGSHVTLALLVDFVALHEGRLILRPTLDALTAERHVDPYCAWQIITNDLFLDEVGAGHSRTYSAGYRDQRGNFHRVALSAVQMRALTELVSRDVPLRAAELQSFQAASVQNPAKVVDAARRAVDVRLSRYSWRSFHTLAGESSDQKRYAFRPPSSLRYACIIRSSEGRDGANS